MKILVLYESFFGNTKDIAQTIVDELKQSNDVCIESIETASLDQLHHFDLIFVGSPTRAFSASPNITAFLKEIPAHSLLGVNVAVFDTRIIPKAKFIAGALKLAGFADAKIISLLKQSGAEILLPGKGFIVKASEGPLEDGELEKAAAWARTIASRVSVS